jgi:hypothetical protein
LVYFASSSGPPAADVNFAGGCFTLLAVLILLQRRVTYCWGLVYSASSSGPPAAEGYFAGGWVNLLTVKDLLQRRFTLPGG